MQRRARRLTHSRDARKEAFTAARFELRTLIDPIGLYASVNELENFERSGLENVELFQAVRFVELIPERIAREP